MTTVYDPIRRITTPVLKCRSCDTPVYFGLTVGNKRAPFELDDRGEATRTLHFINCPDARRWTNRRVKAS